MGALSTRTVIVIIVVSMPYLPAHDFIISSPTLVRKSSLNRDWRFAYHSCFFFLRIITLDHDWRWDSEIFTCFSLTRMPPTAVDPIHTSSMCPTATYIKSKEQKENPSPKKHVWMRYPFLLLLRLNRWRVVLILSHSCSSPSFTHTSVYPLQSLSCG